jgi:hypothetical protein
LQLPIQRAPKRLAYLLLFTETFYLLLAHSRSFASFPFSSTRPILAILSAYTHTHTTLFYLRHGVSVSNKSKCIQHLKKKEKQQQQQQKGKREQQEQLERSDCAVMLFTTSGLAGIFFFPTAAAAAYRVERP